MIDPASAGISAGMYLRQRGFSRHIMTWLKDGGRILVNETPVFANYILRPGDRLTAVFPPPRQGAVEAAPVNFSLVYEDEDLLVVNKPPGIPVHPSPGHPQGTLANGLAWYFQQKGEPFVFHCVNRLDRDTSGLLIAALHPLSASLLSGNMAKRKISRTYRALAEGQTDAFGTIRAPIGRKPGSIIQRQIDPEHGAPAVTHYRTLAWGEGFPTLNCIWKPAAPTRSGCTWLPSAIRCWETACIIRTAPFPWPARLFTPLPWNLPTLLQKKRCVLPHRFPLICRPG